MVKNDIGMSTMVDYLWHLAPSLIYQITPIGTLVASLICFGILTKYNEVTRLQSGRSQRPPVGRSGAGRKFHH